MNPSELAALQPRPASRVTMPAEEGAVAISVDLTVFSTGALFRACYKFTDRAYLYLRRESNDAIIVEFRRKNDDAVLEQITGDFANEMIDQNLRAVITRETTPVREWIVKQAFAEARLDAAAR